MITVTITGLTEVINRLKIIDESFRNLTPLLNLLSSRTIAHFNMSNTPVLTGWFLSNIIVLNNNTNSIKIGEDLNNVKYAARVIFGLNKSGGHFSELGYHLFDRETPLVEQMVIHETEMYINKILR